MRQERLPQVGESGQAKLAAARVAIVGVGATGSHLAETLGRAGVGRLVLIDRDVVELTNLPRQTMFTDEDAEQVRPKAEAAAAMLRRIDPGLDVVAEVADLTADNAERLLSGCDLVLDGTDNFPTRFLVNDYCVREGVPFIYCGVVGTDGQLLVVTPDGPCLRCYVPELPAPGTLPTCDTAGVLGSVVATTSALVATEAQKLLLGSDALLPGEVFVLDGWGGALRRLQLHKDPACPCCGQGEHPHLEEAPAATATELCGRDAVQLPATGAEVSLAEVAGQLAREGEVTTSPFLVRLDTPERRVLVFRDGRVIVGSTRDPAEARSIRARLLGD
ncbi:MAG: ThiF family adenylyltransferase [Planctomycetota bacterium]